MIEARMTSDTLELGFGGKARPGTLKAELSKLLAHHLLVQGNTGAGKSYLLRGLLEGTHGQVQQLVFDIEGEYATLRDVYDDYAIVAAKGGDLEVSAKDAPRGLCQVV